MPFTVDQFFGVFARYNEAIWPLQYLAVLTGIVVVGLVLRQRRDAIRASLALLAALWLINGIGYQLIFFSAINPVARVFAWVFVAQALMLLLAAARLTTVEGMAPLPSPRGLMGLALMLYGLVGYATLGWIIGHHYPAVPIFGVAPCPTTIFTIGALILMPWVWARWLLVIPFLWAIVGGSAAVVLAVPQDFVLVLAGTVVLVLFLLNFPERT